MRKKDIYDIEVMPDEWDRIYGGELTENDFCTSYPNVHRINRLMAGINDYRRYKLHKELGGEYYPFR